MAKKINYTITILCILLFSGISPAEESILDPERQFENGNKKYAAGQFEEAIKDYSSVLDVGLKSGSLYFNLGNSFMKMGKLGEAILNYERAKLLIPRDGDLISNMQYAKSQMKQKDVAQNRHWLLASVDMAFGYFTIGELIWLTTALYYLVMVLIIACVVKKKIRGYAIPVIVILTVFLVAGIPPTIKKARDLRSAGIVIDPIIDARFEPLKRADVNFPLYEGMKVSVLSSRGDWWKVKRPDGKIGWVPANAVKLIVDPLL